MRGLLNYMPYRPAIGGVQARAMTPPAPQVQQQEQPDYAKIGAMMAMRQKQQGQPQVQTANPWKDPGEVMGPPSFLMNGLQEGAQTFPAAPYPGFNGTELPMPGLTSGPMRSMEGVVNNLQPLPFAGGIPQFSQMPFNPNQTTQQMLLNNPAEVLKGLNFGLFGGA